MTVLPWPSRYVGLPFLDHGRDFSGVDCWGLVRLVMKHERGIELPTYGETSAKDLSAVAGIVRAACAMEPWVSLMPPPRPFDVAVMHRRRKAIHMGIMINPREFLHIEEKTDAVIVRVDDPLVAFRSIAYFRHRNLI